MVTTGMPASTAAPTAGAMATELERADDQPVHPAHHRGLDIRGLLRRRLLAVVVDDLDAAQRLRLGVELVLHVHEERKPEPRQRRGDRQVLRLRRRAGEQRGNGQRGEPQRGLQSHDASPLDVRALLR